MLASDGLCSGNRPGRRPCPAPGCRSRRPCPAPGPRRCVAMCSTSRRGQRAGLQVVHLLQQRGRLHRLQHVLAVVAGRAVHAEPDGDALAAQPRHRAHPGGEDHVRHRVVRDRDVVRAAAARRRRRRARRSARRATWASSSPARAANSIEVVAARDPGLGDLLAHLVAGAREAARVSRDQLRGGARSARPRTSGRSPGPTRNRLRRDAAAAAASASCSATHPLQRPRVGVVRGAVRDVAAQPEPLQPLDHAGRRPARGRGRCRTCPRRS